MFQVVEHDKSHSVVLGNIRVIAEGPRRHRRLAWPSTLVY